MFAIGSCLNSLHEGAEHGASWTRAITKLWAETACFETLDRGMRELTEQEGVQGGKAPGAGSGLCHGRRCDRAFPWGKGRCALQPAFGH